MNRALGSRYQLGQLLGRGAMGQVYTGIDAQGNEFAFKILRSELTEDPELVARFIQERSILVSLRHPNLVGVHDLVVEGETVAIVMDLIRGGDLRKYLVAVGTLLPAEVARIGSRIAAGLAEVHHRDVIHRDIKPENILMDELTAPRTPRLTDFGISRLIHSSEIGRSSVLAGTPQYVAPELAAGEDATPASDLYSLGIVLYELSCGVPPFMGRSMLDVIRRHADLEPGRPEGIPEPLWEMISWLLQKGPRSRPQSAQQVATVLEAMATELDGVPVARRLETPPPGIPINSHQPTQLGIPPSPRGDAGWAVGVPGSPPSVRPRRWRTVMALVGILVVLGGGGWLVSRTAAGGDTAAPTGGLVVPGDGSTSPTPTQTRTVPPMSIAPNLVGKKLADAQDSLPTSIKVTTMDTVNQQAPDGTVVAQDPAAGARLDGTMQLTVARQAVEVYLDSLQPVSGQWNSNITVAHLSGETFPHSVGAEACSGSDQDSVEYNVSKGYRRLVTTAGIDDNAPNSSINVQLEIFADGRKVSTTTLEYGKQAPIDVDLSGVLRLKIQWESIAGGCTSDYDYLDLGEAKLLGLPGEVPQPSSTPTS
ncbi:MAG: protein kinase domain-containing protein [Pseudonocardiaceae bacterium]